jgi:hypothetical protein
VLASPLLVILQRILSKPHHHGTAFYGMARYCITCKTALDTLLLPCKITLLDTLVGAALPDTPSDTLDCCLVLCAPFHSTTLQATTRHDSFVQTRCFSTQPFTIAAIRHSLDAE